MLYTIKMHYACMKICLRTVRGLNSSPRWGGDYGGNFAATQSGFAVAHGSLGPSKIGVK